MDPLDSCPCCDERHCDCVGKFCRWCGLCERHCPYGEQFDWDQPRALDIAVETHGILGVLYHGESPGAGKEAHIAWSAENSD